MRSSMYCRENGGGCSWVNNPSSTRPLSLHGHISTNNCNGGDNRIPLPTHKLKDSFIDRLKKRFTFRSKEDSQFPSSADIIQETGPSFNQTFPNHTHSVMVRTQSESHARPQYTGDLSMDTYLRPRRLSQRDINSLNSTMLQTGVLVDPWLLSSMVQPLRQPSRSSIHENVWRTSPPTVPFSTASDSTRSSLSGHINDATASQTLAFYLRPPPPRYWLLAGFGWYWGPLTHSEASRLLFDKGPGFFLVRDSEQVAGRLTLTYRTMQGEVLHHRIAYRDGRYYFVPGEEFESLPDLIGHVVECSRKSGIYCMARDSESAASQQDVTIRHGNAVCLLQPVDRHRQYSLKYKEEKAHDDSVWSCAWGKNEQDGTDYIVTGSLDDKVKVWKWNVDRLEHLHTLEGHHLGVISVDINKSGNMAASSSLDSQVRIWDLESGKQYRYIDGGPVDAWTVAFSPDSRFLASGSHTGNVNLFGVESAKKDNVIKLSGKFTLSIAYSPDGRHLAAGAIDGIISICEVPNGVVLPLDGHAMPVRALAFSPDGRYLVSASDDRQIKLYNVSTGTAECTLTGHAGLVVSADFNFDNRHLVTCSSDKTVRVWDLRNKSLVHTYYEHDDQVWCVRFNPNGSKLISVGDDRQIVVYDCPQ